MDLNEYTLALNDIQHVLKLGIPDEYKGHVYWKMAICYKATGDENKSKVSYGLAQKLLEKNPKQLQYLNEDMAKDYVQNKKICRRGILILNLFLGHQRLKLLCLFIKESNKEGRYI